LTKHLLCVQYIDNFISFSIKEKIMSKYKYLSIFIVLSFLLAACAVPATPEPTQDPPEPMATEEPMEEPMEEAEPESAQSIVDIAVEDGRFTTLVAALQAAGLVETLQGEGPFTVFAPTDDAFAALPEGALDGLLADTEALSSVLLYHVVSGVVKAADVVSLDGQEVATLSGETVEVMLDGENVMINDATVVITDIEGSNGVIHVVDAVILPPADDMADAEMEEMDQTIVDIAVSDENFSTLVTALDAAGLVEALQGEGPFTVFAPTNDAFAALPEGALDALLADTEALTDVLLYHVADDKAMAADVVELDGQKVDTLLGQYLDIMIDGDAVMVDNAQVTVTDIEASNGVIHVIDTVLLPETRTIVDIAVEDGRFTTLVTALQAADLVEVLQADGPFTVFAPTDDAFAALPDSTLDSLLADTDALTKVLLYHVVDGKVMAAQVVELDGQEVETLSGDNVMVMIMDGTVKINDAQVIIADIEASNGVIHVIDAVLVP
jgi:transforming growth factor-beta-induced protein